jgi:F-type H+-transporting ATPase subunit gamma
VRQHPGFFDNLAFSESSAVMREAADEFASGAYDAVYIAYNEFKSVIAQNRVMEQVLPLSPETLRSAASGPAGKAGGTAEPAQGSTYHSDYLFEPDPQALLRELVPLFLNTQLWKAVLESNAAEQGARMAAMDNATENAKELERTLRLKYNQARQSAITTEISEIVSGASALQG